MSSESKGTLCFNGENHEYTIDGMRVPSVTEICGYLDGKAFEAGGEVIKQAALRGTAVHAMCADIDMDIYDPEEYPVELTGYAMAYKTFLRDYRPKWEFIETPSVAADNGGFAGTPDRIGRVGLHRVVLDIKTNASLNRAQKLKYAAQLYGYTRLEIAAGCTFQDCMILHLKKDGTYTVHEVGELQQRYHMGFSALFNHAKEICILMGGY